MFGADYTITSGSADYIDFAITGNLQAGDKIILAGQTRQRLVLKNITQGSAANPIVITNEGGPTGQFIINNTTSDKGIQIWGSKHFKLQGTPAKGYYDYGIKIANMTFPGANAVTITQNTDNGAISSDFEISGLEIADAPSVGLMVKNAGITGSSGTFMQNVKIHHNYIHDTGTEGMYVGDTHWETQDVQELRNIEIYSNITANTGWDGIQLSCATQGSSIHHNAILGYGLLGNFEQDEGIRTNPGTAGDIYNNMIVGSPTVSGSGIFANPYNSMKIYNNVIVEPEETGIVIQERQVTPKEYTVGYSVKIFNNTIVSPSGAYAVELHDMINSVGNELRNNLFADPTTPTSILTVVQFDSSSATYSNNIITSTLAAAGFFNAALDNYRLAAGSPAVNAGISTAPTVTTDFDGMVRPLGTAYDVGAYEYGTSYAATTIASDSTSAPYVTDTRLYTHRINLNASSTVTVNGVDFEYGTGNGGGTQTAKNYTFSTFSNAITTFNSTATGDIHTLLATRSTNTSSASYSVTLDGLTAGERYTFVLFNDSAHNAGRGWYRVSENLDSMTYDVDFSAGGVNSSRMLVVRYVPTGTSATFTFTRLTGTGTTDSTSWVGFAGFVNYR